MSNDILIVDDEADIRNLIQGILEDEGYKIRQAGTATKAYEAVAECAPELIILDIWLQGSEHDGLKILENVKAEHPHLPVIMISGHGTIETAVAAIKKGAYDFIEKPFKSDRLLLMIRRALENAELKRENEALKKKAPAQSLDLVGTSPGIGSVRQIIKRVAATNSRVLLTGEPGTGKEIAARMIYQMSERAKKPFLVLNCATLHPERLEMELFGTLKTKDSEATIGLLEQAHGGTLLLDEVSDMPLETQAKIMRVLQDQKFQKRGSDKFIQTDVRILASTNRDLEEGVKSGTFRDDLYYRLNVVPVHMPPLRDRTADIPALAQYFTQQLHRETGLPLQTLSPSAISALKSYNWPGNARQLRNTMEWTLIMNAGNAERVIEAENLPPEIQGTRRTAANTQSAAPASADIYLDLPLKEARDAFERQYLDAQVQRFDGNISKTAEFVGMERSALHRKIKSLQAITSETSESKKRAS